MNPCTPPSRNRTFGLWLGVLGTFCFSLALPAARLAAGTLGTPALSPWFVTFGSAALAGLLSAAWLLVTRSPLPGRAHLKPLVVTMLGNWAGYPLLLGYGLGGSSASHAAAITALLPLATAAVATRVLQQRARLEFWLCAVSGSALVRVFLLLRAYLKNSGFGFAWTDLLLVGAVIAVSVGYIHGARAALVLGAGRVVCWVSVLALPVTLPSALLLWPVQPVPASVWGGLVCVGTVSLWAGFFAWYRGLAIGGALRVSQTQLLQPFIPIMAAGLLWDQALEPLTLICTVAVVAAVVA